MNRFSEFTGDSLASLVEKGLMPTDKLVDVQTLKFDDTPFKLGVASGDPLSDSVVLWTRLAPVPLAEDGLGGMPDVRVAVDWELAKDPNFHYVVKRGRAVALPELNHAVHVELDGLEPDCNYYYRFQTGSNRSPIGRTKTLPAANSAVSALSFAVASCQAWYDGYYTAYHHMAAEDLDFVMFLGDYIYKNPINADNLVRRTLISNAHNVNVKTLNQYRLRYALFKTDRDLQAAHAVFPWVMVWDDYELGNMNSDRKLQDDDFSAQLQQMADAYQAYYENLPLRSTGVPEAADTRLYRNFNYGDLAEFNLMDTRQYRDEQYVSSAIVSGAEAEKRLDPDRTMLGDYQEKWLIDNLNRSQATWNVLAQTVVMSEINYEPGAGGAYCIDQWDGFVANRNRIFAKLKEDNVKNPIVLSGNLHRHMTAELKANFNETDSSTIGTEFVTTSISSGRDGNEKDDFTDVWHGNAHVPFYNAQRGYIRCHVTPEKWMTDHLVVPYISVPGAPIKTCASFIVENNKPGVQWTEEDMGTGSLSRWIN